MSKVATNLYLSLRGVHPGLGRYGANLASYLLQPTESPTHCNLMAELLSPWFLEVPLGHGKYEQVERLADDGIL